jgi:hypothetical protein
MTDSKVRFRPSGAVENPADNTVVVLLATPEGEMRLEIPAPGVMTHSDDAPKCQLHVIDLAIARLLEARAREPQ